MIDIPDHCSLAATSSCTMTEGVACKRKRWVFALSLPQICHVQCAYTYIEQVVHAEA